MGFASFVAFLVLEILYNLASMLNSLNENNCWHKQNLSKYVQNDLAFVFDAFSESLIGFVSFLAVLAVENVVSFTKIPFIENLTAELWMTMCKHNLV